MSRDILSYVLVRLGLLMLLKICYYIRLGSHNNPDSLRFMSSLDNSTNIANSTKYVLDISSM